jgi:hypothetical protein
MHPTIMFGMGKVKIRTMCQLSFFCPNGSSTDPAKILISCQWGEGRRRLLAAEKHRLLYMDNDRPLSMAPYIGELLDAGIPLLVYNGDRDMTTNMVGTEMVLNTRLEWHGKGKWQDAPRGMWKSGFMTSDEYTSGWAKELSGLTFVVVYNSGHMVPYNVPGPAYDLLVRFLTSKSFIDLELPQVRSSDLVKPRQVEWMHPYPTGLSGYIHSFNDTSDLSVGREGTVVGTPVNTHLGVAWLSIVIGLLMAFVAGLVVAVMGMYALQRRHRRRQGKGGYTSVPDSTEDSMVQLK